MYDTKRDHTCDFFMTARGVYMLIGFAFLLIGGSLYFFDSGVEKKFPTRGSRIVAFGDSLVEGVGASAGNDFVSLLSRRLDIQIVKKGRSGDTTAAALMRLEKDVLENDPRIVILLLGGNDAIRRIDPEETFTNLEIMITRIHGAGAAVLLLGVRGGALRDKYKNKFADLAKQTGAFFVPDVLDGIWGNSQLMFDAIHPNESGYRMIADRVEPVLRRMLDAR